MGSRILHFGVDECLRLPVLVQAGYQVDACALSIPKLTLALEHGAAIAAIVFSEDRGGRDEAIALARGYSSVPLVLFENWDAAYDPVQFDLVIPVATPPVEWLDRIAAAIANRACAD